MQHLDTVAHATVFVLEGLGIAIIALGALRALVRALVRALQQDWDGLYDLTRERIGRAILLGLELLVAADIIRTVALDLTLPNVAALGVVIVLRALLSLTLEVETTGRWPWQQAAAGGEDG